MDQYRSAERDSATARDERQPVADTWTARSAGGSTSEATAHAAKHDAGGGLPSHRRRARGAAAREAAAAAWAKKRGPSRDGAEAQRRRKDEAVAHGA